MKKLLLLAIPLLVTCVGFQLRDAAGPFWLGTNQDPAYPYLFNALSIAQFHSPGHTDHPGTTLQLFGAAAVKLTNWFAGNGSLENDLITRPEFYLTVIWMTSLAGLAVLLFLMALWVFRKTGDVSAALLTQVSPLLSPGCFSELARVTPEIMLLAIVCVLGAVVLIDVRQRDSLPGHRLAVLSAILVGLAVATKLSAIPIALLPLLVLKGRSARIWYCLIALCMFFVVMIPIIVSGKLMSMLTWISGLITHTGIYGSGPAGFVDAARYKEALTTLLRNEPSLCAIVLIGLGILVWSSPRLNLVLTSNACQTMRKGLLAVTGVQILQLLVVAKHPAGRYLLPALALLGVNLALIAGIIQETLQGSSRSVSHVFAGVMIVTLLTFQAPQYLWLKAALTNEKQAQFNTAEQIERYRGSGIIHSIGCSSKAFALVLGNRFSNERFGRELDKRYPDVVCYSPFDNYYYNAHGRMPPDEVPNVKSRTVYWGIYLKHDRCVVANDLELLYEPSNEGLRYRKVDKIYRLKDSHRILSDQAGSRESSPRP